MPVPAMSQSKSMNGNQYVKKSGMSATPPSGNGNGTTTKDIKPPVKVGGIGENGKRELVKRKFEAAAKAMDQKSEQNKVHLRQSTTTPTGTPVPASAPSPARATASPTTAALTTTPNGTVTTTVAAPASTDYQFFIPHSPVHHDDGNSAEEVFSNKATYTYDDIIMHPGHINFNLDEIDLTGHLTKKIR